jgi:tRNA threonylcarbamoyladenosine biosynthesis protein TsaB
VIVLGFDTSTSATAVALRLADRRAIEARDDPLAGAHPGHATRLLEMAEELLAGAGVAWRELDRIAVGLGPGTFTGLRVGIATARGLAQSLAVELVGVSSLRALAREALAEDGAGAQALAAHASAGAVLSVIDARRGEAFAAAYASGEAGAPRELTSPRAIAPAGLADVLAEAEQVGGVPEPRHSGWLAVGDGAVRFREQLESAGAVVAPDGSPLHRLHAVAVCELGVLEHPVLVQEILPDYRRRPDAELALQGGKTAGSVLT